MSRSHRELPWDLVLVDDDEDDERWLRRMIERNWTTYRLRVVRSATETLAVLRAIPQARRASTLVLQDLRMPVVDGSEVVLAIRGDRDLDPVRVAMVVATLRDREIIEGMRLTICGCLLKPITSADFESLLASLTPAG